MKEHVQFLVKPQLSSGELNSLFMRVWSDHHPVDLSGVIERSLTYICAFQEDTLIGYVNIAWDGGEHGFLLDTAVDMQFRRQGVGTELVKRAVMEAQHRRLRWLHVDFEPHLMTFYRDCGFRHTEAGLIRLND